MDHFPVAEILLNLNIIDTHPTKPIQHRYKSAKLVSMIKTKQLIFFILPFLTLAANSWASPGDTLHVVTHSRTTIVTDPSKGFKTYAAWGKFPAAGIPVRQINLYVTLGCPDSLRCADWDYSDHVTIARAGGKHGQVKNYEIARMLTPYGGAFTKSWHFTWETNITDFSPLLRDSVEIVYTHSGYEPNKDRGWALTLDFEVILGTPAWEPVSIQKIYDGNFAYGDSTNSIENELVPVKFNTQSGTQYARLRVYQTGHGMDSAGCGEFCNRYREILLDGELKDHKEMWKKCGDNPLYPQAGTWIFDRANWCPGYLVIPDVYDFQVKPGNHMVDINMQPYVNPKPSANESICAYIIQYKKPTNKNDLAIQDIMSPTDKQLYLRQNPACSNPEIIVENLGSSPVKEFSIVYHTKGFAQHQLTWRGNLGFHETTNVTLPGAIDAHEGKNEFEASLISPNGKNDQYPSDNRMRSIFTKAPVLGPELILQLRTNNQPEQNAYQLTDGDGNLVYERKLGSMQPNTTYADTFKLKPGCHNLTLVDTAGNGLEFWYNRKGGRGFMRLMNSEGQMVKNFDSDFGNSIIYNFEVSDDAQAAIDPEPAIGLFPTLTTGSTTLDYFSNKPEDVTVKLVTDEGGHLAEEHTYYQLKEGIFTYDLSTRPKQRYYLKVFINGELKFNKRIRVVEKLPRED